MKTQIVLTSLLLSMVMFNSCSSNDIAIDNNIEETTMSLQPQYTSKVKVMSRGCEINSYEYLKIADGVDKLPPNYQDVPKTVTDEEKVFIINYIKEHPNEGGVDFTATNYFVQNIGSSFDTYSTIDWNNSPHTIVGGQKMDYFEIDGNHIGDYNAVNGPDALIINLPLNSPKYHDSYGDTDNMKGFYKFYCIEYKGEKNYYLCFDYATHKNSGNEDLKGDGVYNDWVIKITDADKSSKEEEEIPSINNGEVEINVSINDEKEKDDYIASKTSIHVRDTTDFELFIPIPIANYCKQDDTAIVLKHYDSITYKAYDEVVSMDIDNNTVKLYVSYKNEGIYIKSEGINNDVLKYCRKFYQDGITFEIWNYYHDIDRKTLQEYLNKSTIKFINEPYSYINTIITDLDCTVTKK